MPTKIEWASETWNTVVGCSHVSDGCRHCYAETTDHRLRGIAGEGWRPWTAPNAAYNVRLHPERLDAPLRWAAPRDVFVNSMSDLFHDLVPVDFLVENFVVMGIATQHTYLILTKRPERMRAVLTDPAFWEAVNERVWERTGRTVAFGVLNPLPNVWLGVSAERQRELDQRVPFLLDCPAALYFLSCEPLLGPLNLRGRSPQERRAGVCIKCGNAAHTGDMPATFDHLYRGTGIGWVIVGGESGNGAASCDAGWVADIRWQCSEAGIPCFVKQLGARAVVGHPLDFVGQDCPPGWLGTFERSRVEPDVCRHFLKLKHPKGGKIEEWAPALARFPLGPVFAPFVDADADPRRTAALRQMPERRP